MTQCNCSICRRYGAIWAYFRRKSVSVTYDEGAVVTYAWRNGRLLFFRCKKCGCVTHHERAKKRADATDTRAVNMRNVDDPEIVSDLPIKLLDGASSWKVLEETVQPILLRSPGAE